MKDGVAFGVDRRTAIAAAAPPHPLLVLVIGQRLKIGQRLELPGLAIAGPLLDSSGEVEPEAGGGCGSADRDYQRAGLVEELQGTDAVAIEHGDIPAAAAPLAAGEFAGNDRAGVFGGEIGAGGPVEDFPGVRVGGDGGLDEGVEFVDAAELRRELVPCPTAWAATAGGVSAWRASL